MKNKNNSWFAFILFTVVGGSFLYFFGFREIVTTRNFIASSKHAEGEVIDIVVSTGSKGTTMFAPKVTFTDETGEPVTFVPASSSSSPSFHKGEKVAVLYDPTLPEYAKIDSFFELWLMPALFGLFGLIFALLGIWGIISKLRNIGMENNDISSHTPA